MCSSDLGECDAALERLSAECGYRAAWSVWKGTNGPYSRWRVPVGRRDNLARFIAKASGVYELTEARRHRNQDQRERFWPKRKEEQTVLAS